MAARGSRLCCAWTPGVAVVVANSSPKHPSMIRFGAEASCFKGYENAVRFAEVP